MCIMQLENSEHSITLIAFPKVWEALKSKVKIGEPCVIEGKMSDREQVIIDDLITLDELESKGHRFVNISVNFSGIKEIKNFNVKDFYLALKDCKGNVSVLLEFYNDEEICHVWLSQRVEPEKLKSRLSEIIPEEFFRITNGCGEFFAA